MHSSRPVGSSGLWLIFSSGLRVCAFAVLVHGWITVTFAATVLTQAAGERLQFLRSEVQRHDELYHRHAAPEISDGEYDQLKRELHALEIGLVNGVEGEAADSISTVSVADDRAVGFAKYDHGQRMRSLAKAYSKTELRRFHDRVATRLGHQVVYVVEPKFDGIAVSAIYRRGLLARVLTRGNGITGDDVTANAVKFARIPVTLQPVEGKPFPDEIELRGEVYMSLAEFDRLNLTREDDALPVYASPRNLAAGTLKSLNESIPSRRLDVVFYGVGVAEPENAVSSSQLGLLNQLQTWGLPTVEIIRTASAFDKLWLAVQDMDSLRRLWPYPADGVVVKVDSRFDQQRLGFSEEGPEWAIAFKFTPERQTTRLTGITLQIGRTGLITPVAELEPIMLAGATIRRASLHNADEIARRDLRVGDHVVVERGGEIIPVIIGVDLARRASTSLPYVFPEKCPGCAEQLIRRDGQIAWRCENHNCPAQIKRRIRHFASPGCVGIRGLGPVTIEKLVDAGKIRNVADIYLLTPEDLVGIVGTDAATTLMASITHSRRADFWRVIQGLGIEGVGQMASKRLAQKFETLRSLANASPELIGGAKDIPRDIADNVAHYFRRAEARQMVDVWESHRVSGPVDYR